MAGQELFQKIHMENTVAVVSRAGLNKKEELERSWSDLPPELLSLILSHLFAGDCIIFRAICRSWRSIFPAIRPIPPPGDSPLFQSPYLMFLHTHFFNPIYNTTFCMDSPELLDAEIRVSKYSWLLMTRADRSVFFFNPFTKVRIQLPTMPMFVGFTTMCFSAPPTSSDCEVIGVSSSVEEMITISTIKCGEEYWTSCEFDKPRFRPSSCTPILYNGQYYCLSVEGNLLVYNPKKQRCRQTVSANKHIRQQLNASYCNKFMAESDGELLAVFVAQEGSWIWIFKLDLSTMLWKTVQNLGNKMLYVSHPASFLETAEVRGTGNKIYLAKFHGNNGLFYSLATKKYHTFAGDYSSKNFYESKGFLHSTWIKPLSATCVEECNW